jgi:hypothetical protein
MFDVFYIGKKPNQFAHEREVKSIEEAQALSRTRYFWIIHYLCDYSGFDFLWEPKSWESHQQHVYASQWNKDSGTCLCPKAGYTDTQYHAGMIAIRKPCFDNWDHLDVEGFDYSWHPDPTEPPFIYRFGTQWQKTGGPTYTTPGAVNTKYVAENRVNKTIIDRHWNDTSYDFDYTWHPDETEDPYIYQFGTQWQKTGGPRYVVPGATNIKYVNEPRMTVRDVDMSRWTVPDDIDAGQFDFSWKPDETEDPYIYQFGTQWQKTGGPTYTVPGATVTKYVKEPRAVRTGQDDCWVLPHTEFGEFDFTWHPDATEEPMNYQFGTQWQKTGGPLYKVPGATQTKYVEQVKAENIAIAREVYFIDHGNPEADETIKQLEAKGCSIKKRTRFIASYKGTLQRILSREEQEYVWVCSSVCDYSNFDFSWHPEQWQGTMLHVFASNDQQFGDTFLVNVPSFNDRIAKTEVLEWYNTLHFVDDITVPRWPMPTIVGDGNSIVDDVKTHVFDTPLALFTSTTDIAVEIPTVSLWREKTRTIVPISKGNSVVVVPRDAKTHILKELYDYPYIDTTCRSLMKDKPLDVVFISNGEKNAEKNWKHLHEVMQGKLNRVVRSDGVNGRAAAYHAAASLSETPWFFAVFAKLEVNPQFDWSWQPDRMQKNKHYIFHARNPVNGLEYGHMAMIAYHRELTLNNTGTGLDFTLDSEHEVVPLLSGTAQYADDAWTAWRSAFREAIKLKAAEPTIETDYRLKKWLTVGNGEHGLCSMLGAADAVNYYDSVNGEFDKLRLTYEWKWLREYFISVHGTEPDRL